MFSLLSRTITKKFLLVGALGCINIKVSWEVEIRKLLKIPNYKKKTILYCYNNSVLNSEF